MLGFNCPEVRASVTPARYCIVEHTFVWERYSMSTVASAPDTQEALLGPNAQRLEVGLMGARTAAVLRRVIEGLEVDDVDRTVLREAATMMEMVADAVEVVEAGGQLKRDRRSLGFGAMAFTVEHAAPSVAPAELPRFLSSIAQALANLETNPVPSVAEPLLPAFSVLAEVATRQAGTVGEGGSSLI